MSSTAPSTGLPWLIISQLFVTLSLIGFAVIETGPGIRELIIGAVIGHWLKEGSVLGQQVAEARAERTAIREQGS